MEVSGLYRCFIKKYVHSISVTVQKKDTTPVLNFSHIGIVKIPKGSEKANTLLAGLKVVCGAGSGFYGNGRRGGGERGYPPPPGFFGSHKTQSWILPKKPPVNGKQKFKPPTKDLSGGSLGCGAAAILLLGQDRGMWGRSLYTLQIRGNII